METEYDEPVLCNYYDTFSPYIDLTEKYKFVSTTELYNIMKEKSTDFSLRKGWIINTFNDNPNFSFDTPLKVRNLIEKYTLNKSSNRLSSIGSTEWIHLQECKLSELSEKSEVTKIAKKAINDIAKIENVSDVNDIFSYCCKSILSPEGARLPFFENVVNNYLHSAAQRLDGEVMVTISIPPGMTVLSFFLFQSSIFFYMIHFFSTCADVF